MPRKKLKPIVLEDHPVRDELLVLLINGATKASVQKDRKKDRNKYATRSKHEEQDDE